LDSHVTQFAAAVSTAFPGGAREEFRISIAGMQEKTALLWHNNHWGYPGGDTKGNKCCGCHVADRVPATGVRYGSCQVGTVSEANSENRLIQQTIGYLCCIEESGRNWCLALLHA